MQRVSVLWVFGSSLLNLPPSAGDASAIARQKEGERGLLRGNTYKLSIDAWKLTVEPASFQWGGMFSLSPRAARMNLPPKR